MKNKKVATHKIKCNKKIHSGRVITRFGSELLVSNGEKKPIRCTTKRKLDHVACGDNVLWRANLHGNATVTGLLPRKNALTRRTYRGIPKTIAANIDQLIVTSSWLPRPLWELVDRYLIAAQQLDADVIIVMNKSDLEKKQATEEDWKALQDYRDIGYSVIAINAITGEGVSELRDLMMAKTNIFVGRSGVGKSSIAQHFLPEVELLVNEISQSGEGQHTTTTATLYDLGKDAFLIDSPGVRDYVLDELTEKKLSDGYREFAPYIHACRFNNCTHYHEPKCAVRVAVAQGDIANERYQRYLNALQNMSND
ncbi:MAG: ribosome small subunit-dependent GTPase A [Cocleimonas sp.]|nr:ribosome small subunit-dependent GTPase A [Cocleimonas sp.]